MKNEDHSHHGHRQRMYEKFLKYGSDIFEDHEILEIILFYAIPRANTNDIAHALLERFGSLRGVLDASISELCTVEGVGEKSAVLIKAMAALYSRSSASIVDKRKKFNTKNDVVDYLKTLYIGQSTEALYMLMFNNRMRLIKTEKVAEGGTTKARVDGETILNKAKMNNAAFVALAHNHPSGRAIASSDDIRMTEKMFYVLSNFGIKFIDHFIIADDGHYAILEEMNEKKMIMQNSMSGLAEMSISSDEDGFCKLDEIYFEI